MESVISSVKVLDSKKRSRTTRLRSLVLDSKKRCFDGVGHQQLSRTTRLRSLFLDSKKRRFDGVGHQLCQGPHIFAFYLWTPRNEALMESVISSIKDDTSSEFISGLQETKI